MANKKSAKKRVLQNEKRRMINTARKSSMKTAVKKITVALEAGKEKAEVQALFNDMQCQFARAKSKGTIHANKAARKISRLAKKINGSFAKETSAK